MGSISRLKGRYQKEIVPKLARELGITNVHQVPRLRKVVVSVGLGKQMGDAKHMETATNTLRKITGQQPIATRAKKSVAGFKLREGAQIGLKVTLRGSRMYEFTDRFVNLVLPRTRDFRGLSAKSFDPSGNYSIGLDDQSVFPELTYDETATTHGLQITFVIDSHESSASQRLLTELGFPFAKSANKKVSGVTHG